jgi:hypothetical protein
MLHKIPHLFVNSCQGQVKKVRFTVTPIICGSDCALVLIARAARQLPHSECRVYSPLDATFIVIQKSCRRVQRHHVSCTNKSIIDIFLDLQNRPTCRSDHQYKSPTSTSRQLNASWSRGNHFDRFQYLSSRSDKRIPRFGQERNNHSYFHRSGLGSHTMRQSYTSSNSPMDLGGFHYRIVCVLPHRSIPSSSHSLLLRHAPSVRFHQSPSVATSATPSSLFRHTDWQNSRPVVHSSPLIAWMHGLLGHLPLLCRITLSVTIINRTTR